MLITSASGDDLLDGTSGDATTIDLGGNDTLIGGGDIDQFIFSGATGADQISGFVAGAASDDVIALNGFGAGLDEFSEVLAAATDNGTDTTIDLGGGNAITLLGVVVADLHADDFIFGP